MDGFEEGRPGIGLAFLYLGSPKPFHHRRQPFDSVRCAQVAQGRLRNTKEIGPSERENVGR
jgi:hypothetical protein